MQKKKKWRQRQLNFGKKRDSGHQMMLFWLLRGVDKDLKWTQSPALPTRAGVLLSQSERRERHHGGRALSHSCSVVTLPCSLPPSYISPHVSSARPPCFVLPPPLPHHQPPPPDSSRRAPSLRGTRRYGNDHNYF